jgi:hypothetical protein
VSPGFYNDTAASRVSLPFRGTRLQCGRLLTDRLERYAVEKRSCMSRGLVPAIPRRQPMSRVMICKSHRPRRHVCRAWPTVPGSSSKTLSAKRATRFRGSLSRDGPDEVTNPSTLLLISMAAASRFHHSLRGPHASCAGGRLLRYPACARSLIGEYRPKLYRLSRPRVSPSHPTIEHGDQGRGSVATPVRPRFQRR